MKSAFSNVIEYLSRAKIPERQHSSFPSSHDLFDPNLPPYLPLASRVKQLQPKRLESQRAFLLTTPPVIRKDNIMNIKNDSGRSAVLNYGRASCDARLDQGPPFNPFNSF